MNSEATLKALSRFSEIGIIPVVVLEDANDAEPLGRALMEGGLPAAEVTFRTEAAEESIRIMAEKFPDMLVGAGTVLTKEQVDRAVNAGAKFIVSPGFDPEIVKYCLEKDIPVCPGIQTPTELIQAVNLGLDHVKFFPAENAGGLSMINAVGAAFPKVKFMPTGGINAKNVVDYLKSNRIFCCGGSWMVKGDMIKAKDFDKIKSLVAEAHDIVESCR
ncbi:MAG: bifunctional 4-hydroxy-2-oxoglutarate aldolase/2-dehydro-3-deoxy-phosphogluconate aldolase [Eubacterium sp.]|nr:bifunctional 4-hydroxy-2-oxoglutarate aldolase/2-dehydro-3-deoxy-phosphogluconate aldolase [Eubacterium sp.]